MNKWLASAVLVAWALPALAQSTPYHGAPAPVPGTIEAEDFDNGGEGTAYHDTTSGNQLGAYRLADWVDIEASSEHGYNVGKIRLEEWLKYSVNVGSTGSYTLTASVACLGEGGRFHIEFNGVDVTGTMTIPDTGGWQTWTTISKTVTLTAGTQIMKVVVDELGGSTAVGNWNYFTLAGPQSTPYHPTPAPVPGTIEAEDFDNGGEQVAYHDTTPGNQLGAYRLNDWVDIEASSEHGYNVGKIRADEWLKYSVNVAFTGSYTLNARVACLGQGGTFHIEFNGVDKTGPMAIPDTGAWQTWTTISKTVTLTAGTQIMKVVVDAVGGSTVVGNWNYFTLAAIGSTQTQITVVDWNIHKGREECVGKPHYECDSNLEQIATYLFNKQADIVSLNEVMYRNQTYDYEDQPRVLEEKLEAKTGQCWDRHFVDMNGGADEAAEHIIGNLLLWRSSDPDPTCTQSPGRFQKQNIFSADLESVTDGSRSVGGVTLIIGSRAVTFFTTHLCAPSHENYIGCTVSERQRQVEELKTKARGFAAPRVISGDFNARPSDSEIGLMTAVDYFDSWAQAISAGRAFKTGGQNSTNPDEPTSDNDQRFDYIFRSQDAFLSLERVTIERQQNPQTGILVADHYPVAAVFTVVQ